MMDEGLWMIAAKPVDLRRVFRVCCCLSLCSTFAFFCFVKDDREMKSRERVMKIEM